MAVRQYLTLTITSTLISTLTLTSSSSCGMSNGRCRSHERPPCQSILCSTLGQLSALKLVVNMGRSDGGGVNRYICPPKLVYLTNFYVVTGCFFLFDPGQIRYRASVRLSSCFFYLLTHHNLYPPPNEIPGYAPGSRLWQARRPWFVCEYDCTFLPVISAPTYRNNQQCPQSPFKDKAMINSRLCSWRATNNEITVFAHFIHSTISSSKGETYYDGGTQYL